MAARYYAAAHSGDTRIPGMDGPARTTIAACGNDMTAGYRWTVRAIDAVVGDRGVSDGEMEAAGCYLYSVSGRDYLSCDRAEVR